MRVLDKELEQASQCSGVCVGRTRASVAKKLSRQIGFKMKLVSFVLMLCSIVVNGKLGPALKDGLDAQPALPSVRICAAVRLRLASAASKTKEEACFYIYIFRFLFPLSSSFLVFCGFSIKGGRPTSIKITGLRSDAVGAGFTLPSGTDLNGLYGRAGDGLGSTSIYVSKRKCFSSPPSPLLILILYIYLVAFCKGGSMFVKVPVRVVLLRIFSLFDSSVHKNECGDMHSSIFLTQHLCFISSRQLATAICNKKLCKIS